MQRAKFSLASVLLLFTASAALAQTNDVSPNDGAGVVSLEDNFSGTASLGQGAYIDVRNMAGSGVGYRNGYTQVGAFLPLWGSDDWFIAPQARLIVTDTQRVGANIGAVARRYVSDWDRIVGANLYYDYDESYLGNNYHQVGFGFETLGQWWDARGNVYLPTGGGQTNNMGPAGLDSSLYYIQNQIAVRGYDFIEQSLKGGDIEFGVPVLPSTPWLRAFGGAYFYSGDGHNPTGVRGRIDANISNDLLVGLNVTHDNVYGTNLNAVVDFRFSGFLPTRYFPQWTTQERMLTQVQRNWRITTDQYLVAKDIPVINPRDDQPYFVVHVDSNNAAAGDGTAENPYQNLPGTVPVPTDLVLVQRGQSTEAAPYTGNIQLVDYARMLGEGKAHIFDGYVTYGSFSHVYNDTVLPGFSNSGLYPFLSNPAGDIVTLANHNEVSAFVMQNASGAAIAGNGTNGFHLNNLEIAGNAGGGIVIQNAIGNAVAPITFPALDVSADGQRINTGLIADINRNTVGGYTPVGPGVGNNGPGGILIDTGAAGLTLDINRVTMNVNAPGSQTVGVHLTADDGDLVTRLNDVVSGGNSPAVGNTDAGIILTQTGATTLTGTLTGVNVSSNLGDGLRINGDGGTTAVTAANLIANSNAGGRGIDVTGTNNAQMGVVLNGGSATGNGNDGLRVLGGLSADLVVGVSDFNLSNNGLVTAGAANVNVGATGAATANVLLDTVAAGFVSNASNNDYGLLVNSDGAGSLAWVQAIDSNFNNAGLNAVNVAATTTGTANINLDNTTGNAAGLSGFVAVANGGTVNLEIENASNFNNAGVNGFDASALAGGTLNMAITGSTFNNSGSVGLRLLSDGVGSVLTGNLDTVSANSNGFTGLFASGSNSGELNLRVLNSQFNLNGQTFVGGDGVTVTADTNSTVRTLFYNTQANGNDGDGFDFNATGGSYMSARLDTITARFNGGYGVNFNATGSGDAMLISEGVNVVNTNFLGNYNVNFTNVTNAVAALSGSSNNSAGDGFSVNMTNVAGAALVTIDGNGNGTIDGNTNHGIDININGADQVGVRIEGYQSISNNGSVAGDDGIHIDIQNVATATAVDIIGVTGSGTIMADNLDDGIDINLVAAALGTFNAPVALTSASVLTRTDSVALPNESDPPLLALPVPVNIDLGTVAPYPVGNGILIDSIAINSPTDIGDTSVNGIIINGSGLTGTGDIVVQNVAVNDSLGNGVAVALINSTVDDVLFTNVDVADNLAGHGIWLDMNGGTLGSAVVSGGQIVDNAGYGVWIDLNGVGATGATDPQIVVDGNDIRDNTGLGALGSGVAIHFTDTPLDLIQVSNNTNISGNFGDGVQIFGTNSPVETLAISGNTNISSNTINGINVGMIDSNVTDLLIQDNVVDNTPPPSVSNFDITLNLSGMSPAQIAIFQQAAARWAEIIVGDVPDVGSIDDVLIDGSIVAIDGVGGILGQAGPTAVRGGTFLPYTGVMQFDSADVAQLMLDGEFDEVILHEMGHVIGFGTIWDLKGLLLNAGTIDPRFTGANATAAYNTRFATSATNVPVEGSAGPGTNDAHWRESIFDNELMTGFLNSGVVNPISAITIASMADLGYTVNMAAADPYLTAAPSSLMSDLEILRGPITIGPASLVSPGNILNLPALASNTANGINISLDNSDVTTLQILRNQVLQNGLNGVLITSLDSTHGTMLIDENNISDNQGGDGVQLNLTNGGATTVTISNNSISNNSENGINFELTAAPIGTLNIIDNNVGGAGALVGLDFLIPDATNAAPLQITNSSAPGYDITGFILDLTPTQTVTPPGSIWDTIEPGASSPFMPFGGTDVTTGLNSINGTAVVGPITFGPGATDTTDNLGTVLPGGGVPDDQPILDLGFNDFNPGETFIWSIDSDFIGQPASVPTGADLIGSDITVNFTGGLFIAGTMQPIVGNPNGSQFIATSGNVNGGGVSANGADGIRINQTAASDIGALNIAGNVIQDNGLHGVELLVDASNLGPVNVTENVISGHANGDGFRMIQPDDTNSQLDLTFARNTIDANTGGRGVNIELPAATQLNTVLNLSFRNDAITNNGFEGVRLDLTGNTNNLVNNVTANVTVLSDLAIANPESGLSNSQFNGNGGIGLYINSDENSDYSLTIGGTGTQNQFNGNGGAGVGIDMEDASTGVITASNATFSNNLVGSTPGFTGSGFAINMIGASQLTSATFGSAALPRNTEFSGNAANGLELNTNTFAVADNITVRNSTATGNTGDGLHFDRSGDSAITDVLITTNILTNNSDGIDISARGADTLDNYLITTNTISTNTNRGVSLFLEADADLAVDFTSNTITNNGGDGIQMRQNGGVTDTPTVEGVIMANTITGNGGDGIDIGASHLYAIGDGTEPNRNTISNNVGNGILISGASDSLFATDSINLNTINDNGLNGIAINSVAFNNVNITSNTILRSGNDGIQLDSTGARLRATLTDNLIRFSGGDGVQIRAINSGVAGLGSNIVTLLGNDILDSGRRGVNVLNGGSLVRTTVNIGDGTLGGLNAIERSQLEGVYVVNTSSTAQNVDANANTAMDATGALTADPRLVFNMQNNFISANGAVANAGQVFDATGLVIRVGTSDGGRNSITDQGGFADTRGGVVATVTNNLFGGQYGADVTFQSFVSTGNPGTTTGTWTDQNTNPRDNTNDVFSVTSYSTDPLARLDLTFTNNSGEGWLATRGDGAAYTNAEAEFKSRGFTGISSDTATDAAPDDFGPFGSGTRPRNAQRLAGRFGLTPTVPTAAEGAAFLYPGLGTSTFRVNQSGNNFPGGTGFILDAAVYTNPAADANGTFAPFGGPFGIDNLPWGWSALP